MPLLSDPEAFDRQAGQRAQCGIDSGQGTGFTVEEVCERCDYPMPTTEEELDAFANLCETWGIKTNIDDLPYFKHMRERHRMDKDIEFWRVIAKIHGYKRA